MHIIFLFRTAVLVFGVTTALTQVQSVPEQVHYTTYISDRPLAGASQTFEAAPDIQIDIPVHSYSAADMSILYRIVEAEATGQSLEAKKNMASVILNRLDDEDFQNTIEEVVFARSQFSPTADGRYWDVEVKESTMSAVDAVIQEGRTTEALFFCNMSDVKHNKTKSWFRKLHYLFTDDSNTSYYK